MREERFPFSEDFIREQRRRLIIPVVIAAGLMAVVMWFLSSAMPESSRGIMRLSVMISMPSFVGLTVLVTSLMAKRMRSQYLILSEDWIEKRAGDTTDAKVQISTVRKMHVLRNREGRVELVRLGSGLFPISICGYENMDKILDSIELALQGRSVITTKQQWIDWNNPWVYALVFLVLTPVLLGLLGVIQAVPLTELIFGLVFPAAGVYFCVHTLRSRIQAKSLKKSQLVVISLIIIGFILFGIYRVLDFLG